MDEPPPRPPKKQSLQNRKLSPNSVERIRQRQNEVKTVKYKPPAPDPDPLPPDFGVTQQWLQQVANNNEYLIGGTKVNLDTSDSGCSSLASRSPSSATSPMHQSKPADQTIQGIFRIIDIIR